MQRSRVLVLYKMLVLVLAFFPLLAHAQIGIVDVTVVGGGNVSGLTVEMSRSIAGLSADFAWRATTDVSGHAVVAVQGKGGYYQARLRGANGATIAQWSGIALNAGNRVEYEVSLNGQVRYVHPEGTGHRTSVPSMVKPEGNWQIRPLFTVGETINGYTPPGLLDGIGAMKTAEGLVRVFVNHENGEGSGYAYTLRSGVSLQGSRVSYFDIDPSTYQVMNARLAYHTIIDAAGNEVRVASQINGGKGIARFCSGAFFRAGQYGLVDDIYFAGEEVDGGLEYALDVKNGVLYALPWLGKAAWENVTLMDSGSASKVAILIGDDRAGAPLLLYLGTKTSGGFLARNGLAQGEMYVWVADNGNRDPNAWNGTNTSRAGKFVKIAYYDASLKNLNGYDALGFATQTKQDELANAVGAFKFSRPEDVATNPSNGTQAVLASTGRGQLFNKDDWGKVYHISINFGNLTSTLKILYDGDDAGAGQFANSDSGLRSPDNLDWAGDGMVYVQEDRSTALNTFGGTSKIEASIWKLNPGDGKLTRIAIVDRSVVPQGQIDSSPNDIGNWETSGILDVTSLFDTKPGERLLIADVQAHSVRGGIISSAGLGEGGQLILLSGTEQPLVTSVPPMVTGQDGWNVKSVFTVGETIHGYTPPGLLDGIGAMRLNNSVVRVFANHELGDGAGYVYKLANGVELAGARISYFDLDARTHQIIDAGLAYDTIIDAAGRVVTSAGQINAGRGLARFCSGALFEAGQYGLVDDIYFAGEEVDGGLEYALDVKNGILYALPWLGKAAWENVTLLATGNPNTVAVLIGDDRAGAPLLLYMGYKNAVGDRSFLDRNGLARGDVYVWVADSGERDPNAWNGTGTNRTGRFKKIQVYSPGAPDYDSLGFATQTKQDALANEAGAFKFSRPEDVATNPKDGTQAVLASTGRGQLFNKDDWGKVYLVDVDFQNLTAKIDIWYDGDDAGKGQFTNPDLGLRSPDNLDWADNGMVYIQEDRSTALNTFGGVSKIEASIWQLNPTDKKLTRIGVIDRSVLPSGQTDGSPTDLGNWETSGILDVTSLFHTKPGERLLIADVEAHSVRSGIIASAGLGEGGQLIFLSKIETATKPAVKAEDASLSLDQNLPNPFNPATTIRYSLGAGVDVRLAIYNVLGQEVRQLVQAFQPAGNYTVVWDGRDAFGRQVATGVYMYRLEAGSHLAVRKMLFMK